MKHLDVELPDKVAEQIDALVRDGWFQSEGELMRMALLEFLHRRRLELDERFQREDITWAIQQKIAGQ